MAELEGLTHSGICATDLVESEDFYVRLLGAKFANRSGFHIDKAARGRSLNTVVVLSNYLLALMVPKEEIPVPPRDQTAGDDPFRHGFAVSQQRFSAILQRLQEMDIPYEGPVTHPENGPLGQSIYFQDPAGNFMEICWRRDEAYPYNPTLLTGKLTES